MFISVVRTQFCWNFQDRNNSSPRTRSCRQKNALAHARHGFKLHARCDLGTLRPIADQDELWYGGVSWDGTSAAPFRGRHRGWQKGVTFVKITVPRRDLEGASGHHLLPSPGGRKEGTFFHFGKIWNITLAREIYAPEDYYLYGPPFGS